MPASATFAEPINPGACDHWHAWHINTGLQNDSCHESSILTCILRCEILPSEAHREGLSLWILKDVWKFFYPKQEVPFTSERFVRHLTRVSICKDNLLWKIPFILNHSTADCLLICVYIYEFISTLSCPGSLFMHLSYI